MPVWSIGYDTGLSIQRAGFNSRYGRRGADDRSSGTLVRIEAARCKAAYRATRRQEKMLPPVGTAGALADRS